MLLTTSDMVRFGLSKHPPCSVKSGLKVEAKMEAGVQVRWVLKGERVQLDSRKQNWVHRL